MRNLLKKDKGFTLIEIVLVLAIAGLILVIVFLAVSGAQKSRRDTQRKNDVARIAASLESYASNNKGAYPTTNALFRTANGNFWDNYVANGNYTDPSTGNLYTDDGVTANNGGVGHISVTFPTARTYIICVGTEQGTKSCVDNQ